MAQAWTIQNIPEQTQRVFVITGANSGIGLEAARALAQRGATILLACRDKSKGEEAAQQLRAESPRAVVEAEALDLASLASVRDFAQKATARFPAIHALINNAGVMALPKRQTADGFEMQFGTNHLGHFALTGLLLPGLLRAPGARVVSVSSILHRRGKMNFDDLQSERSYDKNAAYGQSKLANLLFAYELQRRLAKAGKDVQSLACHPGYSATNLQGAGPKMSGSSTSALMMRISNALLAQSAAMGALPTLYAATAPEAKGGDFIGPGGLFEMRGWPKRVTSSAASHREEDAARLWEVSEALTGLRFAL
jgi:NAD(P)-dependent dehydrogenase (short-subunit alcohol dehydrogenase family)